MNICYKIKIKKINALVNELNVILVEFFLNLLKIKNNN